MKANELKVFHDIPDHIDVVSSSFDGFSRLYFYNSNPFDMALFITKKDSVKKVFEVEFLTSIERDEFERSERATKAFSNSAELVAFIKYKLTMLIKDGF